MGDHERASAGHASRRLDGIPPGKAGVSGSEGLAVEEVGVGHSEAGAAGDKHGRAMPQLNPCKRRRRAVFEGERRQPNAGWAVLAIENDALLGLLRPPLQPVGGGGAQQQQQPTSV